MEVQIERVAPDTLPEGGPDITVVVSDGEVSLAEQYRRAGGNTLPDLVPLAGFIRTPPLASPDAIELVEARRDGQTFRVALTVRSYSGALFGNVETVGLVRVALGVLQAGQYELVADVRTLPFDDLAHPDDTDAPAVSTLRFDFQVV